MFKLNAKYDKLMQQLFKIRAELFKINNPPKFKIGEEVIYMGYGIQRKKITDITIMGIDDPCWFYSFGVTHDWTSEVNVKSIKDVMEMLNP